MPSGKEPTRILDYSPPPQKQQPHFLPALLLCLPGLVCWCALIVDWLHLDALPIPLFTLQLLFVLLVVSLPLAPITAVVSIVYYWRKHKPWYVVTCLITNIAGLLYLGSAIMVSWLR